MAIPDAQTAASAPADVAPVPGDIASFPTAEPGPRPVVRAVMGLLTGAAVGALAALLVPRPERSRPPAPASRPRP